MNQGLGSSEIEHKKESKKNIMIGGGGEGRERVRGGGCCLYECMRVTYTFIGRREGVDGTVTPILYDKK